MVKFVQTQYKFKYAHQQILFFKLLFNVELIYSVQVIGPWLWGNRTFFLQWWGSRGRDPALGANNAPPVHGIKNALISYFRGRIHASRIAVEVAYFQEGARLCRC
jgi:hypothetical protein